MPSFFAWTLIGLLAAVPLPGGAEGHERGPALTVLSRGTLSELWIDVPDTDGRSLRRRLRVTPASVRPGVAGRDPAGRTVFATWTEGPTTWSSFSRDSGDQWSEPRPLAETLRLRTASVPPGAPMPTVAPELMLGPEGELFLVQFHGVSLPEWRDALEQVGATVLSYLPHNAHVVRAPRARLGVVEALEFVRRVEPYEPAYRLDSGLRDRLAGSGPFADEGELRVRVMAFDRGPAVKRRLVAAAESFGARLAAWWPSGHTVELEAGPDALRRLAAHDDVAWIDRWFPPETDMDLVRLDAGSNWLEASFGFCGQGVRGEVLDSGIQLDHVDFDGVELHGPASLTSHGTHVYGIVFGNGARDGDGQAKATGLLPCAEQGYFADFDFVTDRFAHTQELKSPPYLASFQTNSWGNGLTTEYSSYSADLDDIIWRLDIAITQSMSNQGSRRSRPQAWAKNVISVGGIKNRDTLTPADDSWNRGASIGPASDGRIKPDLSYWYEFVWSPTIDTSCAFPPCYRNFGGTSAATPQVAGVLGQTVQMWAENVWGTNPTGTTVFEKQPHFGTIKALLINNAQPYAFSGTTHDLTRVHQGWGRPSVRVAAERAASSFVVDQDRPLEVGQAARYLVEVPPDETELRITMTYPDPPGTTSASLHRINDVDLRVVSPSAVPYHGNVGLLAGNASTPGGSPNGIDTVENVFVRNPESGLWIVEVSAPEVNVDAYPVTPQDDVVFALVVTGAERTPRRKFLVRPFPPPGR
jgi:hypothetical protein